MLPGPTSDHVLLVAQPWEATTHPQKLQTLQSRVILFPQSWWLNPNQNTTVKARCSGESRDNPRFRGLLGGLQATPLEQQCQEGLPKPGSERAAEQ